MLKLFISIILFNISLFACAGGYFYDHKDYHFLDSRELPFAKFTEELNQAAAYNDILYYYNKESKEINLKEWQKQLGNNFSLKQIEKFIYKRENLDQITNKEILAYLEFVAIQEKYTTSDYYYYTKYGYDKEIYKNLPKPQELINQALVKLESVKSDYLKLRYFYLAFRLSHFQNLKPLDIYKKYNYLLENKTNTIVKDWTQGIYAGALVRANQKVKGVYEFSKLLDEKRVNWHLSFYNFHHIKTNEQWEQLLALSKTKDEKIKFYTLRALYTNANLIEELKNIEQIDINSKWYDLLIYRDLSYAQHFFDENRLSYSYNSKYYKDMISYLKTVNKKDMYLVDMSLAYYTFMQGDYEQAQMYSNKTLKQKPNLHEAKVFAYVLYLNRLEKIDKSIENDIYNKLTALEKNDETTDLQMYTYRVLTKLYKKNNKEFKSFLTSYLKLRNNDHIKLQDINNMKTFFNKKSSSNLEKMFTKELQNLKTKSIKSIETTLLVNNLMFKKALALNSNQLDTKVFFNPFNAFIKGNNRKGSQNKLTLKQFLKKVVEIENKLKANPKSVMDNYLFANAIYNLSFAGNNEILTTVYRSVYSYKDKALQEQKLNKSIYHYKQALKYAKNREFKTKITYMLAKSELAMFDLKSSKEEKYFKNRYSFDRLWYYGKEQIYYDYVKNGYGKFFDILKNKYEDTDYYKELIKECANLRIYNKIKQ